MLASSVARFIPVALVLSITACDVPAGTLEHESAEVVVADGGIPRRSFWSYWDRGGLGTSWRASAFDDTTWRTGAGPLGYGESYLSTTVGFGGDSAHKHVTTYFRTRFTISDPAAVHAMRGDLMYDDGIVVYLNGLEIGRDSMPLGTISSTTFALGHEANNTYRSFDWTEHTDVLRAGVNTIAVEIHQAEAASSDLVFDLGLVVEVAPPPPPPPTLGGIPRSATWAYWDRGGDLGISWRAHLFNASTWTHGRGPLGYGETYLGTTVGYGGNANAKHITTYFRAQFELDDPSEVSSMVGELMYDDGVVVYLNGNELDRRAMPSGTITATTLSAGHEANNAYEVRDWTDMRPLLRAGVNTIAVEVHQQDASSSDLVFDLSLTLQMNQGPPPPTDDLPRGSTWTYWDRGGDLGTAWRGRTFDDISWARGAGPLGYGETYVRTPISYGGDPNRKHVTTYFRAKLFVEDPGAISSIIAGLMHDDGAVVYINGQELARHAMPGGTITASTLALDWESGNNYVSYDYTAAAQLLVPGENVIAVEVHQASRSSSDLTFDLELDIERASRRVTERGVPSGSTWGYWDRGGIPGTEWRQRNYAETGWRVGAAPLGFGEDYLSTETTAGGVTTYFRHDFTLDGSKSEWVLEAFYDDGFVAYLNGVEVLRVGLPAGTITPTTLASGHEAVQFEQFRLPNAYPLVVDGVNTLAIEVHQANASSSDLVWDARLFPENVWPRAWEQVPSPTLEPLHDVWFSDALHGWAVGGEATLLRTFDGGSTWEPQANGGSGGHSWDIDFADVDHGWIVGDGGEVMITTDGGNNWTVTPGPQARSVSFVDANRGWISGPSVHRTTDGGATWQLLLAAGETRYHAIDFVDANNGWLISTRDDVNYILRTSDGGLTWTQQHVLSAYSAFGPLDAVTPTFACVGGVGNLRESLRELIFVTRNGSTWQLTQNAGNDTAIHGLHFINVNEGWAVGYGGSIIHTVDGGMTWSVQERAAWVDSGPDDTIGLNPSLYGVHFIDAQRGWVVGRGGTILRTTNGGRP